MNAGVTAERVYDALKRRILDLQLRPGVRLDPAQLSDMLGSSVTPVREGLNRLRGEGLVETRTNEGFFLPQVDAPALQDLYGWNAEILFAALRRTGPSEASPDRPTMVPTSSEPLADATAALFDAIARRSSNAEHQRALASANDRLHAARIAEEAVLEQGREEIEEIGARAGSGQLAELRRLIAAYHRRRHARAAEIVRRLYRPASS